MKNPLVKTGCVKAAFFSILIPLLLAAQAMGATIAWDPAPSTVDINDASQVLTDGTLFLAATAYPSSATVNGITFQSFSAAANFTPGGSTSYGGYTATNDYGKLINYGSYLPVGSCPTTPSVISGLTSGHQYKIQVWLPTWNSPWPIQLGGTSNGTNSGNTGASPTLQTASIYATPPANTQSQYIMGIFTASGTTQNLYQFAQSSWGGISALQVRDVTPGPLAFTGAAIYPAGYPITGSQTYNATTGTLCVTGAGNGLWTGGAGFHADQDYFAYSTATYTGDVEIVARLVSVTLPDANNGQAGLMMRASNSANEVNRAAVYFVPNPNNLGHSNAFIGSGPAMDGQIDYYNSGTYCPKPALNPPYWLKLVRVGKNFGSYWSLDGRDWILLGGTSGGALFGNGAFNVGLFVDSYFGSGSTSAVFDNIYIGPTRLKYKTSWIGATSVGVADGNVSNQVYAMWVKPDTGACYTNSNWDESGETGKIYKDGKVFHRFLGPGINGAHEGTITGNASNVFYYNMLPTPGVWCSDFTTANPVSLNISGLGEVRGLAASATTLFVSDYAHGVIRAFNATPPFAEITTSNFPITLPRCGPIAYDGANFWVIQAATHDGSTFSEHTVGTDTPSIRCYSPTGADLSSTHAPITDVAIPTALAFDNRNTPTNTADDRLWVCDNGPNQNVRYYTNLTGNPTFAGTFGQTGGLWQKDASGNYLGHPGQIYDSGYGGDARFYGLTGIGVDNSQNIYVACNGASGSVTDVRKFNSSGTLQWRVNGLVFLHNGDFDPASDGQHYYTTDKHFTLNWANTAPGSEWSYTGYTRDITKDTNPVFGGVRLARMGSGNLLYKYTSGQGKMGQSWMYFFNGETAVPFGYNWHEMPSGLHRLWIDANNNQAVDTGEEATLPNPGGEATAFDVDNAGDIWMTFQYLIRRIVCQSVGPEGGISGRPVIPKYSLTSGGYEDYPVPAPLTMVWNLNYDRTNDILYAVGKKADGNWALARCDQWRTNAANKTDPVATWCVNLVQQSDITIFFPPPEPNWAYFGLDVAGDKIFVAEIYGPIHVYDTATGNPVIRLIQGPEVSARFGWDDMVMGVSAVKRSTGEYLVTEEGAGWNASNLLYRWTPSADTTVTAAPAALTATPLGHKVALSWAGPTGMVTSYNLYRGTSSGGETLYQSGIKGPTFTDLNVSPSVTYYYKVTAVNAVGESASSNEASAMPVTAQVEFVKYDTTTQGTWKTVYGTEGYNVAGQPLNLPPSTYLTSLTPVNTRLDYWATDPTTDTRALQMVSGSNRTSAFYPPAYGANDQSWEFDFADDSTWHQVSIYLLDWTNHPQGVKVEVLVKGTTTVLDTRNPTDYNAGKWLVWNVRGDVTIRLTNTVGYLPYVSGIFFDPVQTSAAPALGWWKLDETGSATIAADSSGAGNNATKSFGTWNTGGKINGCLSYGGTSSNSQLSMNAFNPTNAPKITYTTWFKTATSGVILGMWNSGPTAFAPVLYVGTDNKLHGAFYTGVIQNMQSTASVNDNAWHQAALTSDGALQTLYLDGEIVGALSAPVSQISSNWYYFVGGQGYVTGWPNTTGTFNYFNGQVDDIRLYNRVLSSSEIWKLKNP